jgi:hypothetical protein
MNQTQTSLLQEKQPRKSTQCKLVYIVGHLDTSILYKPTIVFLTMFTHAASCCNTTAVLLGAAAGVLVSGSVQSVQGMAPIHFRLLELEVLSAAKLRSCEAFLFEGLSTQLCSFPIKLILHLA